jgi:hypothetical protein
MYFPGLLLAPGSRRNLITSFYGENPEIIDIMLGNLMELVDSYLKPSNTEKRLLGEVFTPLYGKSGCVKDFDIFD